MRSIVLEGAGVVRPEGFRREPLALGAGKVVAEARAGAGRAQEARAGALLAAGLAPARDAERARSAAAQGDAQLRMRQEALRMLDEPDLLALRQAKAAVAAADLELQAARRLQEGLVLRSPAAGRVATPLEDAPGRWFEPGAAVLEVAAADRSEVTAALPPSVPWTELAAADALVPSTGQRLPLSMKHLRFEPGGARAALDAPAAGALDGATARVRFHLGARPLAFQYAVDAARALRFELWAAELDPSWITER